MITLATVAEIGLATVQDGGRPGLADIGVPGSGAWHRRRYLDATRLLRGQPDPAVPAIEVLAGRLALQWAVETTIAVIGPVRVQIDSRPVPPDVSLRVAPDHMLVVEHIGPGPAYLVIDGWHPLRVLGSAATDTFSGISAIDLRVGTRIAGIPTGDEISGSFLREVDVQRGPLRVLIHGSGQDDADWLADPWIVSSTARSGTRLRGGRLRVRGSQPSMPVVVGALQATPEGELIVLGPDGGLTGGYPIVGVVCSADLPRVSEVKIGDPVTFRAVGIADAVRGYAADEAPRVVVRPGDIGQDGSIAGG